MPTKFSSLFLFFILASVHAANDWSKPCFSGVCSYDLPDVPDGPSGTLKIWGADTAIADITTAGGWDILGCDQNALDQDIRIVCRSGNDSDSGCAHLFSTPSGSSPATSSAVIKARAVSPSNVATAPETSGTALPSDGKEQGAVGKIVRLPQNCGKQPFARISKAWTPADQSIPSNISKRFLRRAGQRQPTVTALHIDTNFSDSDAKWGPVGFALVGANVPGATAKGDLDTSMIQPGPESSSSSIVARQGASQQDFASKAISFFGDLNFNKSKTFDPLDVNKSINLINQKIDCSAGLGSSGGGNATIGVDGQLQVNVDAKAHAVVTLGLAASGSIFSRKVDSFEITSSMTADLDGTIVMSAGVGGSVDSGKILIGEIGVPGLDFPGIFSIGPSLQLHGQAIVSLDLDVDMTVGVVYHVENAQFTFPSGDNKSGGFNPGDTPLKLSAQPSAKATGKVEAHLIPSLNFGISAIGDSLKAGVFVDLDASASMTLTVEATGDEGDASLGRRSDVESLALPASEERRTVPGLMIPRGQGLIGSYYFRKRSPQPQTLEDVAKPTKTTQTASAFSTTSETSTSATSDVSASTTSSASASTLSDTSTSVTTNEQTSNSETSNGSTSTASDAPASTTSSAPTSTTNVSTSTTSNAPSPSSTDASFGGCLEMDAGLDVNVGADGNFFGLFDPSVKFSLFSKKFTLFQKCFGDQQAQRRSIAPDLSETLTGVKARAGGLVCNKPGGAGVAKLVEETISAAQIQ